MRACTRQRSPKVNDSDSVRARHSSRVPLGEGVPDGDGVDVLLEELAGLQVHELADDVDARDLEVVPALAVGELVVQVARLGVDEVRGERLGVPAEQGVRQRHVAPVEADQVQPDQEHRERVDEPGRGVGPQRLAEQRAVGQREREVLGDEHRLQPLAVGVGAAGDDADRLHARDVQASELAQQLVLAVGHRLADLLDRDDPAGHLGEPHDVPGDTAGEGGERLGRPLLERDVPRQVQQRGVGRGRGDLQALRRRAHGLDPLRERRRGSLTKATRAAGCGEASADEQGGPGRSRDRPVGWCEGQASMRAPEPAWNRCVSPSRIRT